MNCVNCGAPPLGNMCRFCGTRANVVDPAADLAGFDTLLRLTRSYTFDSDRLNAVRLFPTTSRLTSGQVRAVLRSFTFDSERIIAARALIPMSLSRYHLLGIADVFTFDSERNRFVSMVTGEMHTKPVVSTEKHTPKPVVSTEKPWLDGLLMWLLIIGLLCGFAAIAYISVVPS